MKKYQFTISTNKEGEKDIRVVMADNKNEAIDKVIEQLVNENVDYIADYYEVFDLCESGQTVDEYAQEHGLICGIKQNATVYIKADIEEKEITYYIDHQPVTEEQFLRELTYNVYVCSKNYKCLTRGMYDIIEEVLTEPYENVSHNFNNINFKVS
jgi:hypothetical protein